MAIERRTTDYPTGIINTLEDHSIPRGAFSDAMNWLETGGKKELRAGSTLLGTANDSPPAGEALKITGLHSAKLKNGTERLWAKMGRKLKYWDTSLSPADWTEVGTDIFPVLAKNDDVLFTNAETEVGTQVIFGSLSSSLYRMNAANLTDYTDMFDGSVNSKGYPFCLGGALFFIQYDYLGLNYSDFMRSHLTDATNYTDIAAEVLGSGDGATKDFSGTLVFKAGSPKAMCFTVNIMSPIESFADDGCGNLTSPAGGTGTINYTTGAWSVSFFNAPALAVDNITANYSHENSNNSGLTDFTSTTPVRVAAEGWGWSNAADTRQAQGGRIWNIVYHAGAYYPFHETAVFRDVFSADDTTLENKPALTGVGISNYKSSMSTGQGIFYIDNRDTDDPQIRILELAQGSTELVPRSVSKPWKLDGSYEGLDLSDYRFNDGAIIEWGKYIIVACRHKDSTNNDTVFAMRKDGKSWSKHNFSVRNFIVYDGYLLGGSSISQNVFSLFDGITDEDINITNYVEGGRDNLGYPGEVKKFAKYMVRGEIQENQNLQVWMSFDGRDYELAYTILWNGDYVDTSVDILIGTHTIGTELIGGSDTITVHPYQIDFKYSSPYFNEVKIKYVATDLGYVSVTEEAPHKLRRLGKKLIPKYQTV